jgi:hypothetical protein
VLLEFTFSNIKRNLNWSVQFFCSKWADVYIAAARVHISILFNAGNKSIYLDFAFLSDQLPNFGDYILYEQREEYFRSSWRLAVSLYGNRRVVAHADLSHINKRSMGHIVHLNNLGQYRNIFSNIK